MNDRTDDERERTAKRTEGELASEERLDPRLTLDAEGDAETRAELAAEEKAPYGTAPAGTPDNQVIHKGQHERPGPTQPMRDERSRMGETAIGGENVAKNDGLLQTNQVDTQGLPSPSQATPADAGPHAAPVRTSSGRQTEGNRDGGYGANRDRERSMNEPGGFAPGARMQERDPVAVGNEAERSPRPGVGQPTGPENTWRERGDDDRVVRDDNRQYNTSGEVRRAPASDGERPDTEKSASIDVGTDETSGDR